MADASQQFHEILFAMVWEEIGRMMVSEVEAGFAAAPASLGRASHDQNTGEFHDCYTKRSALAGRYSSSTWHIFNCYGCGTTRENAPEAATASFTNHPGRHRARQPFNAASQNPHYRLTASEEPLLAHLRLTSPSAVSFPSSNNLAGKDEE